MNDNVISFDAAAAINKLARSRLEEMRRAGETITECYRVLQRAGHNVVGRCLAHQGTFYEFDHYPKGDVYDSVTHCQYYYHAHRPESGEHGHFHTFIRAKGMPDDIEPAPYFGAAKRALGDDALAHLVAISMNGPGYPIAMFTTNRWVTDETFYAAHDVLRLVDMFEVDHTEPCLAVNRWLTAMLRLFRPQVRQLVLARDQVIGQWANDHADKDVYEDRDLEITSFINIDVDEQIRLVDEALAARRVSA